MPDEAIRLSRPCYNKLHRCPGWAGGGMKSAKESRCDGGRVRVDYEARLWRWRFWRCNTCRVVVLPYAVRWVDPGWLRLWPWSFVRELQWRRRARRG